VPETVQVYSAILFRVIGRLEAMQEMCKVGNTADQNALETLLALCINDLDFDITEYVKPNKSN